MALKKLYIQQISYDGSSYTKGRIINTADYNIGISSIPFKYLPDFKECTKRDWGGIHGVDVYVPKERKLKEYTTEIEFVYRGTHENARAEIREFLDFFRHKASDGTIKEARFAMYDECTKIGRKDVICNTNFNNVDVFVVDDNNADAVIKFKLKFDVCDPNTDAELNETATEINF